MAKTKEQVSQRSARKAEVPVLNPGAPAAPKKPLYPAAKSRAKTGQTKSK